MSSAVWDTGETAAATAATEEGGADAAGADGQVMIRSQRSNSSEGWVDQYTNSSVGGSREDLAGVEVARAPASSNE